MKIKKNCTKRTCCTLTCLHTRAWSVAGHDTAKYRGLCFTWTCLDNRSLSCSWRCLHHRGLSCISSVYEYTTEVSAAPDLRYRTTVFLYSSNFRLIDYRTWKFWQLSISRYRTMGKELSNNWYRSLEKVPSVHLCQINQRRPWVSSLLSSVIYGVWKPGNWTTTAHCWTRGYPTELPSRFQNIFRSRGKQLIFLCTGDQHYIPYKLLLIS